MECGQWALNYVLVG